MIIQNKKNKRFWGVRETGRYGVNGKEYGLTLPGQEDYGKIHRRITEHELQERFIIVRESKK